MKMPPKEVQVGEQEHVSASPNQATSNQYLSRV